MSILIKPKMVSLDSSTLGKISKDFWHNDSGRARRARDFIDTAVSNSIYIVLSLTHLTELLRHANDTEVANRIRFLQRLPLVAWPRRYDLSLIHISEPTRPY